MLHWTKRRTSGDVGWIVMPTPASLIWDAPAPFARKLPKPVSAKSVQLCPAVVDFDARHVVVPCPIDLHVRFAYDAKGVPRCINADGAQSTVRPKALGQMIAIVAQSEWRHPDRPIIQIITPYVFVADSPVWLNQLPPFLDYAPAPLPGVLIAGRFPIHIWPRPLMWAFEWHDIAQPIVIARGQPWFTLRFDTPEPGRIPRLVEAMLTPEVKAYIDGLSGVTNYVSRTFSLFDRALGRRPRQLLVSKR